MSDILARLTTRDPASFARQAVEQKSRFVPKPSGPRIARTPNTSIRPCRRQPGAEKYCRAAARTCAAGSTARTGSTARPIMAARCADDAGRMASRDDGGGTAAVCGRQCDASGTLARELWMAEFSRASKPLKQEPAYRPVLANEDFRRRNAGGVR